MKDRLAQQFGGKWDGDLPEIHGLVSVGKRKLKVELLYVKTTDHWQCCIFEGGEVLVIEQGEEVPLLVGKALSKAL